MVALNFGIIIQARTSSTRYPEKVLKKIDKKNTVLDFQINGKLENIYKLPSKIKTEPIYIDSALLFLNKKNQLIILN